MDAPLLAVPVKLPVILFPVAVPLMIAGPPGPPSVSCIVTLVPLTVPVTGNWTTSPIAPLVQFGSAAQPAG